MPETLGVQGEFNLLHKIGEGGMADVFLAERLGDDGFKTRVALKRLHRGLAMDSYFIRQLVREARLLGQLEHANIVKVYDLRRIGDEYYVVMEFVDGIDLAAVVKVHRTRKTRIPRPFFFHVALSLSEALSYAHGAVDADGNPTPLIHRDIKPSNVMLSRRGIVKLTDFGIAHVGDGSVTGGLVQGTANYMSPEQAFGEERLLPASDVYSLGSVFYEMLTGRPLVDGDNYLKAIHQVRERRVTLDELAGLGVEPGLRMVVAKMLSADQTGRYQEMDSVRNDLQFVAERLKIDLSWHRIRAYVGRLMGILGRAPDRATLSNLQVPEEIKAAANRILGGNLAAPEGPATPPTPPPRPPLEEGGASVTHAVQKDLLDSALAGASPLGPSSLSPPTGDGLVSSPPTAPPTPPIRPAMSTPATPRTPVPALRPSAMGRTPAYQGETVTVARPEAGPGSADDPLVGVPPTRPPVSLGLAPGEMPQPPPHPAPRPPAPPPMPPGGLAPPDGWDDEATRVYTGKSAAEQGVMGAGMGSGAADMGPETRPIPWTGSQNLQPASALVDLGETTLPPGPEHGNPPVHQGAAASLIASSAAIPRMQPPPPVPLAPAPAPPVVTAGGQPSGVEEETDTETWLFEGDGAEAAPAQIRPERPKGGARRKKRRKRRSSRPVSPLVTTLLVVLILLLLCTILMVIAIKQNLVGQRGVPGDWYPAVAGAMVDPSDRRAPAWDLTDPPARHSVPDIGADRA
jgi:eukaryotic-like serine/threonine-protein kinase